jgi:hypothetical protein
VVKVPFDFSDTEANDGWTAIEDRFMGGSSHSRLHNEPATIASH